MGSGKGSLADPVDPVLAGYNRVPSEGTLISPLTRWHLLGGRDHLLLMWMEADPSVYLTPRQDLAPDHLLKEPRCSSDVMANTYLLSALNPCLGFLQLCVFPES